MNEILKTLQDVSDKLDAELVAFRKANPGKDQFLFMTQNQVTGAMDNLAAHIERFPDPTPAPQAAPKAE